MKKPNSVGYFSSYDRGLECLLTMWPEIRKQAPTATLDIAYGWNTFDAVHKNNPQMQQWKFKMMKLMRQDGVKEHGRLSHEELAKLMKTIKVWAYPTEFTEIHCITALKTAEAGMQQVHTGVAALAETAENGTIVATDNIYSNTDKQQEFITAVAEALKDTKPSKQINKPYWSDVAQVWAEAMA